MRKITGPRAKRAKARFLSALTQSGVVTDAARGAGVSRDLLYTWRQRDPKFAAAWEDAWEAGTDRMEAEAIRRAVEGVEEPIFQGGVEVGKRRIYSDGLLKFLLQCRRPNYLPRLDVTSQGNAIDASTKILIIPPEPDDDGQATAEHPTDIQQAEE